jgi:hypothetical protein
MLQFSFDDVGELLRFYDHRCRFFARHRRRRRRRWRRCDLSGFSCFTQGAEMFPNLVGNVVVERTGMRFSLNPECRKILQDEVALDLQFTCQNVDSYVAHSVFLITLPCLPPVR